VLFRIRRRRREREKGRESKREKLHFITFFAKYKSIRFSLYSSPLYLYFFLFLFVWIEHL
jgi:hypothetical protein